MHIRELFPDVISEDLDLPYSAFYEHFTIFSESLANQGISGQIKEKQNNDKSIIHLPRHSSFIIMQDFAKWGRVRHNMAESLGITTV